eukprot:EG_transcript_17946
MSLVEESLIADDKKAIKEMKQKLATYADQKTQVDELLATDPDNLQVQTLSAQIQEAIKLTRNMIDERWAQLKQKEETKYVVGATCEARYEQDKWYTCRIEDVILPKDEDEEKRYMVSFVGFVGQPLQECTLHQLRPFRAPPPDKLAAGTMCRAVFKTGKFCECVIDQATSKGTCWVTFQGYQTSEEIPVSHIRLNPHKERETKFTKRQAEESEATAQRKQQKLERLKQRQEDRDKELDTVKKGWADFAAKMNRSKKLGGVFHTKHRESLFKSPASVDGRVGVMWSGKAMTEDSKFRPLSKGDKP